MASDASKYVTLNRERNRAAGFVMKSVWVKPKDVVKLERFLEQIAQPERRPTKVAKTKVPNAER